MTNKKKSILIIVSIVSAVILLALCAVVSLYGYSFWYHQYNENRWANKALSEIEDKYGSPDYKTKTDGEDSKNVYVYIDEATLWRKFDRIYLITFDENDVEEKTKVFFSVSGYYKGIAESYEDKGQLPPADLPIADPKG